MVFLMSIQLFKEQCINEGKNKKYLQQMQQVMKEPVILPTSITKDKANELLKSTFPYTNLSLFNKNFYRKFNHYLGNIDFDTQYDINQIILNQYNTTTPRYNVNKTIHFFKDSKIY